MSSGKKTLVVPHRDVATELLQHSAWLGTRFSACWSFLPMFTNSQGEREQGAGGEHGDRVCGGEG